MPGSLQGGEGREEAIIWDRLVDPVRALQVSWQAMIVVAAEKRHRDIALPQGARQLEAGAVTGHQVHYGRIGRVVPEPRQCRRAACEWTRNRVPAVAQCILKREVDHRSVLGQKHLSYRGLPRGLAGRSNVALGAAHACGCRRPGAPVLSPRGSEHLPRTLE
jgi:hypothetical protein